MKVTDFLTPEEIKEFTRASDARGFFALAVTWGMIASGLSLVAFRPAWWSVAGALIILGGRHLALAILAHDCSHYSLFRTRWLNDWIGKWLCGAPIWLDLHRYRKHHWRHHQLAGTKEDPDEDLVSTYPVSRGSMLRKFARDLIGLSGIKRVYGLILMDLGLIEFTVSNSVKRIDQKGRRWAEALTSAAKNLFPVIFTNLALFAILWATGHPELYLLWIAAYLTTFSLILRIRSIAEHACAGYGPDPRQSTRTTYASPLARITVAPHRVNYHLEHHILMTVPYFRLPQLHQLLREREKYASAFVSGNYVEVLAIATGKESKSRR